VQGSSAAILLNFFAKNPPHRQALFVGSNARSDRKNRQKLL